MPWIKRGLKGTFSVLGEWRQEARRLSDGPDGEKLDENFGKWTSKLCRHVERLGFNPEGLRVVQRRLLNGQVVTGDEVNEAGLVLTRIEKSCLQKTDPQNEKR